MLELLRSSGGQTGSTYVTANPLPLDGLVATTSSTSDHLAGLKFRICI